MQNELHNLERYLHDALGIDVTPAPWRGIQRLPPFLRALYSFAQLDLLGTHGLLIIDANPVGQSPAAVRKHVDMLQTRQNAHVIYVRSQVTAYNRKRLMEHKVPFVVPGNQMYLPMLAIDLREHFLRLRSQPLTLSPSTQALLIHALLRQAGAELTPLEVARRLGYSAMTMTRAFDELEGAHLGAVTARGRERCLRLAGPPQTIWDLAQPFLRSPVSTRLHVPRNELFAGSIRAGLTALAQYSMLAPPACSTYALSAADWKSLRQRHKLAALPAPDPDAHEIEVWTYPPALFAEHKTVDPLSLYLSLKGDADERTQAALDEMMRKLQW